MFPTRKILALLTGLLALGVIVADMPEAHAQYYHARPYRPHTRVIALYPKGLYVGGGMIATRILDQQGGSELLDHGGGATFYTGLRVNRNLALEAGWIGTLHNPEKVSTSFGEDTDYLVLNGFTGDAKIFLKSSTQNMEPFLQAGVGLYLLDSTYVGTQSIGTGFQAGGGFNFKVGRHFDLGVRALYRGMSMGPPEQSENDTFVSAITVDGNLSFRF